MSSAVYKEADVFARSSALLGDEALKKLRSSVAMVFGLGGVGGHCAESLLRVGLKKLYIVDKDSVAPSNINRQILAKYSNIGISKAEIAKLRFESISPFTEIVAINAFYLPESPVAIPEDVDIVLDCIDTVSAKIHIMQTCAMQNKALISSMGMGNRFDPSAISFAKLDKTTCDPLARVLRKLARERNIKNINVVYSKEIAKNINLSDSSKKATPASLPFVPSTAGILMAYHACDALINDISLLIPLIHK